MRFLRPTMPLLIAALLALGAAQASAETLADEAEDAYWSCVKDFARALAQSSPLESDAITEQSLRSCNAALEAYRRVLMQSPEGLAPDDIEARLQVSRQIANSLVFVVVDAVRSKQPVVRGQDEAVLGREGKEPDNGIWMNHGLTEEQTAEVRHPSQILQAAGAYQHQP